MAQPLQHLTTLVVGWKQAQKMKKGPKGSKIEKWKKQKYFKKNDLNQNLKGLKMLVSSYLAQYIDDID